MAVSFYASAVTFPLGSAKGDILISITLVGTPKILNILKSGRPDLEPIGRFRNYLFLRLNLWSLRYCIDSKVQYITLIV